MKTFLFIFFFFRVGAKVFVTSSGPYPGLITVPERGGGAIQRGDRQILAGGASLQREKGCLTLHFERFGKNEYFVNFFNFKIIFSWKRDYDFILRYDKDNVNSCGHTSDFYLRKTDLPKANSSKISRGKFLSGFVLPRQKILVRSHYQS